MDVIAAHRDVGTYRGTAEICGTTHKTVRRIIEAHEAAHGAAGTGQVPAKPVRTRNYDEVAQKVAKLPAARLRVFEPVTGELHAEHALVAPGETSILDAHYDRPRPATPRRGVRPRTPVEREFLALGSVAEQFLTGAAAAGVAKLNTEIGALLTLGAAHGHDALTVALERAVAFGRWRADDVRSILATNGHAPRPTATGQALVMTLPTVPTRSLDAYANQPTMQPPIEGLEGGEVS